MLSRLTNGGQGPPVTSFQLPPTLYPHASYQPSAVTPFFNSLIYSPIGQCRMPVLLEASNTRDISGVWAGCVEICWTITQNAPAHPHSPPHFTFQTPAAALTFPAPRLSPGGSSRERNANMEAQEDHEWP